MKIVCNYWDWWNVNYWTLCKYPGSISYIIQPGIASDYCIQWRVQSTLPSSPPVLSLSLSLSSSPLHSTIDCSYDGRTNWQTLAAQVAVVSFDAGCFRWINERIQGSTGEILATLTSYQRRLNVNVYWTVKMHWSNCRVTWNQLELLLVRSYSKTWILFVITVKDWILSHSTH